LTLFLQCWPMESACKPTLCKCKRGATAVHCYGRVTIDRCGTGSAAGQACKLVKPSRTRARPLSCRAAAEDDRFRSFVSPNCFPFPGSKGFLIRSRCRAGTSGSRSTTSLHLGGAAGRAESSGFRTAMTTCQEARKTLQLTILKRSTPSLKPVRENTS
jgi:hypothetical protein